MSDTSDLDYSDNEAMVEDLNEKDVSEDLNFICTIWSTIAEEIGVSLRRSQTIPTWLQWGWTRL